MNICVCNAGYNNYDGVCARCEDGQLFIQNECIFVCGADEVVDLITK